MGVPYSVRFAADASQPVVWSLGGHLSPALDKTTKAIAPGYGLAIDSKTGVLSGTPTTAGTFTFQVQSARDWGRLADSRTYVLAVDP